MGTSHHFDTITAEDLRSGGGLKWTLFPDTIGAFVAEMDFGTAPVITEALHRAIDQSVLGYLPPSVSAAMSTATASWMASKYGWDVPGEHIHPVADVITGLQIAIEHFSRPNATVIVPTPAYMPFLTVPASMGRRIIEVPLASQNANHTLDLDAIDRAFADGGELLILCNPYNPVGRVFTREELIAVSEVVTRHGGRVFSDEIHAPLIFGGRTHVPYASISPDAAAHTITSTSASKAWNLPGLKCAQVVISNDADAQKWQVIGPMASHGASNLGVIANTAAYTAGAPWLDDIVDYTDRNRQFLGELVREHLPGVRYIPPEGTYIAWLDARELGLGDHPSQFFQEHAGVTMTDGRACGAAGAGFMRFIFATPRPIIEQSVLRMAAALANR